MISRRNVRATGPQEQPRRFAFNYSRGVDTTKAPTDLSTVISSKNLVVNFDGSLSIRKPLEISSSRDFNSSVLYDGKTVLEWGQGNMRIVSDIPTVYRLTTYLGEVKDIAASNISEAVFAWEGSPEIVNLNNATVVGNVVIKLNLLDSEALNSDLYDDVTTGVPRYLRIFYDDYKDQWVIEIMTPEPVSLNIAEGEISLNPNLVLDNPYAIRDTYGQAVPTVKGILAYVLSTVVNGERVLANTSLDHRLDSDFKVTTNSPTTQVFEIFNEYELSFKFTCRNDGTDTNTWDVEVSLTTAVKRYSLGLGVYVHINTSFGEVSCVFDSENPASYVTTIYNVPSAYDYFAKVVGTVLKSKVQDITVAQLTESVKTNRYAPITKLGTDANFAYLKAFGNYPSEKEYGAKSFYASWFESKDGITWTELSHGSDGILVRELDDTWKAKDTDDKPQTSDYVSRTYYPMYIESEQDLVYPSSESDATRIDIVPVDVKPPNMPGSILPVFYKFKIIAVERISSGDVEYDSSDASTPQYRVTANISESQTSFDFNLKTEILSTDLGNAVLGKKLYYKKALYSYGHPSFKNNILVSDTGSFITPLYNIIDVDTVNASEVTCLIPWRDYLVSATDNAIYIHTPQGTGYLTKTVNTSVGIPKEDASCCKSILNGILFKSGDTIYQLIPNLYSGDDSTLNIKIMSHPVSEFITDDTVYNSFAIATSTEYIVMLPAYERTVCLRFDFSENRWTILEYPVTFTDYFIGNVANVYVQGEYNGKKNTYLLDAPLRYDSEGHPLPYADLVEFENYTDISFELDTGQKTDGIAVRKQFVESKFVFATTDEFEMINPKLVVAIDGDPHITTVDVSTDAPFWKSDQTIGVAGTTFRLTNDTEVEGNSESGILRQLVVRYSGKGHAIRHILTGKAHSNFKLYETYVKYKPLKR